MKESTLEKKSVAIAKSHGWLSYKFTSPQNSGVPDRLFIRNGKTIFVEFKRLGETPRPLQAKVISDMRSHGAVVHVIDNLGDAKNAFE